MVGVKGAFFWRKRRMVSLLRRAPFLDLKNFGAKKIGRKTRSLHPAPTEKNERSWKTFLGETKKGHF